MTVGRILSMKGHDVVTAQPHRTLAETAKILADRGIGAVIITGADGEVLGILSERDIVRAAARGSAAALNDPVSRHMTAKVVTATEDMSVTSVMEEMTKGRFRHIPVLRHGRLDGLISIGDLVKYRLAEVEGEHRALREYIATA